MSGAAAVYDSYANDYNEARWRLIPPFDALYGTAVGAVFVNAE